MKQVICCDCSKEINNMEIALNLKIIGKQIGSFRCYSCLSEYLNCDCTKLIDLAQYYQDSGCLLFQRNYLSQGE